jgi:hypothetical protein
MRRYHGAIGGVGVVVALHFVHRAAGLYVGGTAFEELSPQQVLKVGICEHISNNTDNTAYGFMGYGGALTLVNGSPYDWTLSSQSSYQMNTWEWPKVAAGTTE